MGFGLEMCVIVLGFFGVFFMGLISDKASFSKVKATSHELSCKDSFTFWQNEKELYVSIYMCVYVEFHFP